MKRYRCILYAIVALSLNSYAQDFKIPFCHNINEFTDKLDTNRYPLHYVTLKFDDLKLMVEGVMIDFKPDTNVWFILKFKRPIDLSKRPDAYLNRPPCNHSFSCLSKFIRRRKIDSVDIIKFD